MKTLPLLFSLIFSLCADYLFLATPYEFAGVLLFILVQSCHSQLLGIPKLLWLRNGLSLFLPLAAASCALTEKDSPLLLAALFYFCLLFCNFIHAWSGTFKTVPWLFCVCLSMLMVCDLHVGLYNLPRFVPELPGILLFYCRNIAFLIIWIFYIPSQLIILLLLFYSVEASLSDKRQIIG